MREYKFVLCLAVCEFADEYSTLIICIFYNFIYHKMMVSMIYTIDTVHKRASEDCAVMALYKLFYKVCSKGRVEKQFGLVS